MKKNINILGSCVSRDTFGMSENDGGFHIEKCVTNSSIFSLCSPKLSDEILCCEDDFPNSGHYYQRCAVLDINKNVFDYVNESEFDYIVIDFVNLMSKQVLQVRMKNDTDEENFTYITRTQAINENPEFLENAPFDVIKSFNAYEDEFTMMAFVYQYAEIIQQHFDQDKIIILEAKPMERYIDNEGNIKIFSPFNNIAKKTHYISEAYEVLENSLPKAHVIKFPNVEVLCNANHKWGVHLFHYISEYYSYALDCVRAIAGSGDRESEKILLRRIKSLYEQIIRERYACTADGCYPLKNKSFISSKSVRLGEPVTICLNAEGGTGKYFYEIKKKKKLERNWQQLDFEGGSSMTYEPMHFAVYEICVKASDENNVVKKEYFEFVVH